MDEEKTTMNEAMPETVGMNEVPEAGAPVAAADVTNEQPAAAPNEASEENKTTSRAPRARIKLDVQLTPVVNYAQQQNGLPLVRRIAVSNAGEAPIENVELRVSSPGGFVQAASFFVASVPAGGSAELSDAEVSLNAPLLASLTERVTSPVIVEAWLDGEKVAAVSTDVTFLAFDEWHGDSYYPELLAAFVTPNHAEIAKILARAAKLLEQWTGSPSFDAYQTQNPNRVLKQAAAIYAAIQELNIVYAVPPASFETAGQRVRLCDAVVRDRLGSCLDLSLLYASCLEAAGLYPLLLLSRGHAFAGVWLEEMTFQETVKDDPSLVSKRMAEGIAEIAVMECTCLCAGRAAGFDDARTQGAAQLNAAEPVRMVLDVHRARLAGIRPLPQRVQGDQGWTVEEPRPAREDLTAAPEDLAERIGEAQDGQELDTRARKIRQWERKLLDLGLRNALINLRSSKNLIPVLAPSLPALEDALADGRQFTIEPRPGEWHISESAARSLEPLAELAGAKELLASEAQNGRLRALMGEAELARTVKELYRAAKTALEENGANSLYLSLGLLKWYETDRSERPRYAPLVLLPVEIARKAANKGYCLRLRDEDAVMNVTLLEMLRQNFGIVISGLDPLPTDEHGVDVVRVFTAVRRAVMTQKRWDVIESAFVGIFSFSRFVMWNDIRNRMGDLEKNKVVQSLMDGRLSWEAPPLDSSEEIDEDGLLLPLPVDASQLYAVKAAVAGETFVLHGPPGTGKSQTITGMIINLLARGKTVLFVAEKMAALSVVQKRLRKLGLDPFCLELHSNKARKKDVLDQLKAATEITRGAPSEVYRQKAEQAAALRAQLSGYPRALHRPRTSGLSVYAMIGAYEPLSERDDAGIRLDYATAAAWTAADLEANESLLKSLTAAASAVGHPAGHPLRLVAETEYSQKLRSQIPPLLEPYEKSLSCLERAAARFAELCGLPAPEKKREYKKLRDIAAELTAWKSYPREWAQSENAQASLAGVREMAGRYAAAGGIAAKLEESYRDSFLQQDGEALRVEWNEIQQKWALPRYFAESGFVKKINSYAKDKRDKEQIAGDLDSLIAYRREAAAAQELWQSWGALLGPLGRGSATNWALVGHLAQEAAESAARLDELSGASSLRRAHASGETEAKAADALLSAWNDHAASRRTLSSILRIAEVPAGEPWIASQREMCAALRDHADILRDWIQWNSLGEQACARGLEPVVAAYRNGLAHDAVLPAYRKVLLRSLIEDAIDNDEALNRFSGSVFDEKVRQIKALIDELSNLCKQEAYNTLAANVPNFAREASQNSELGILQRAIRSGGRNLSIRRLFEQLPNLLPRLCPCMLMSPISAAQYLDPRREMFDCVIFDEASQLTTSKAVGALARGSNAVVVGDPKQMPPTSFFMTSTDDSEEDPELADLTSILDDCLALGMPETHLLWHYRSRHESLIAFSNNQFYENKLYTFPSVNDRLSKVSFVHVAGQFDRGRTRSNRAEAEAVVAEVIRRAKDPELRKESIGIVTFNIGQQNLIDDLFEEARGRDLALEKWYQQSSEPLFIKNLENVQGDERDVILFSVGFGMDREGRISMNFGPINQVGGWRRLNVAVSRSRTEMMVFSSLLPEQIDLGRTASEGVAALKAFLQYARTGYLPARVASAPGAKSSAPVHGVADEICARLKEAGYETQQQVGHSKFKIDIGVIDPDQPEEYLLGILLDGETYRDAKTVRDREFAQIGVLEGLGWKIKRIWTMDWWDNKKRELNALLDLVETLRRRKQEEREIARRAADEAERAKAAAEEAAKLSAVDESTPVAPSEPDETPPVASQAAGGENSPAPAAPAEEQPAAEAELAPQERVASLPPTAADETDVSAPSETDDPAVVTSPEQAQENANESAPAESELSPVLPYRAAKLSAKKLSTAEFLERRNEQMLLGRLEQIVADEAPISSRLLTRRLLQSLGMTRLSPRAQEHLDGLIASLGLKTTEWEDQTYFWTDGQNPDDYGEFRENGLGVNKRDAADVPPQEAANAAIQVLREQIALPGADLLRETAKLLGYTRMGSNVSAAAEAGLALATRQGRVTLDRNGHCVLAKK